MQFITADLFRDFPTLKFIIPHGGRRGAYHWWPLPRASRRT